jgi:hypothetical protein
VVLRARLQVLPGEGEQQVALAPPLGGVGGHPLGTCGITRPPAYHWTAPSIIQASVAEGGSTRQAKYYESSFDCGL